MDREISRFIQHLSDLNVTAILLSEMVDPTVYPAEHYLAHGVIFLHNFLNERTMIRAIQIIKMRGTKHDCDMRELAITDSGLVVSNQLR